MAHSDAEFPRAFRGYDPEYVDSVITRLRRELVLAKTELDRKTISASELAEQVATLQNELEQVGKPTFSGLGKALVTTLSTAEQQAKTLLAQASADAYNLKLAAERELARATDEERATVAAESARAREQVAEILAGAERESARILRDAQSEAARIISDAEHEATTIHRRGVTEVARERADMVRELEMARAHAERETAELRLIVTSHAAQDRASTDTDAILDLVKLEANISVRREELEQQLLDAQSQAVTETQHFLDEAHLQIQGLRAQQSAIRRQNDELHAQAEADRAALMAAVDQRALLILAQAQEQAREVLNTASARADETLREATARLESVNTQRDVLSSHLDEITDVIAQAESRAQESVAPTKSPRKTSR